MEANQCACGCGEHVNPGRRFRQGHHMRVIACSGSNNPAWRDGRRYRSVAERAGMNITGLDVHHRDHDRTNNALSNLQPLSRSEHTRLHRLDNWTDQDYQAHQSKAQKASWTNPRIRAARCTGIALAAPAAQRRRFSDPAQRTAQSASGKLAWANLSPEARARRIAGLLRAAEARCNKPSRSVRGHDGKFTKHH